MDARSLGRAGALLAALALPALAAGQAGAPTSAPMGAVTGVVFDSLVTAAPLRGAEIWLAGTPLRAVADSAGRFRVEGVPPGRYTATFFHPLLDSLGLASPMVPLEMVADGAPAIDFALPSERTLFASVCGRLPVAGEGLALGTVIDAADERPVAAARVEARWVDFPMVRRGSTSHFVRTPRAATATTTERGEFALCGVPNDVGLEVNASAGERATGAVTVFLEERLVGFRQLVVARVDSSRPPAVAASASAKEHRPGAVVRPLRRGGVVLEGRVVNKGGRPVADAVITADAADLSTRTDSTGAFRLVGLAPGSQDVVVRAIGYAPVTRGITAYRDRAAPLLVTLDLDFVGLPTISVVGKRESRWDRTGFENRRWQGFGRYLTRDDIKAREASYVTGLLRGFPSLEVVRRNGEETILARRGARACDPDVYLDGTYVPDGARQLQYLVRPDRIVGLEVYEGMSAPGEFIRNLPPCASIVIWTTWSNRP